MDIDVDALEVVNDEKAKRYEVRVGDKVAFAQYSLAGSNIVFTHTEVPPEFEGMGIGSKLARYALDDAVERGLKIQPLCPFINSYVRRHPEYHPHAWGYSKRKKQS